MSSGSDPGIRDRNAGTIIVSNPWAIVPIWQMKDQFERYYSDIRDVLLRTDTPGYSVFAVYANHGVTGHAHLPMARPGEPGGTLIVGRHDHAEMRLAADPTVALRHVALRVLEGDEGGPEVRLLDLNTGQGFHIEGAGVFEGARVSGPAFVRIGSYALMLFPRGETNAHWPSDPVGLYDAMAEAREVQAEELVPKQKALHLVKDRERRGTLVVKLGAPVPPKRHREGDGPLPHGTCAVLTMREGWRDALFALTVEQLEVGVLLGRYERCEVETCGLWANEAASRVHLLLLKEGDQILAIDTASSNGTLVNGAEIEAVALPDDAMLELAPMNNVRWHRLGDSDPEVDSHLQLVPDPEPEVDEEPKESESESEPEAEARGGESEWKFGPCQDKERDDENLPSILALVEKPPPPSHRIVIPPSAEPRETWRPTHTWKVDWRSWGAGIGGLMVITLIVGLMIADALRGRVEVNREPEPQTCIHPMHDFGTDSPALRLYLQHQDPDVCFQYRWSPWVEEMLNVPESTAPEPDWIP